MTRIVCGAVVMSLLLSGCGEPGPTIVAVEGTLSLAGKPLENVYIEFWPENNGPKSSALTDAQGKFVMKTADGLQTGAIVSKHRVVLLDKSIVKVQFLGRAGEDVDMTGGQKPRISELYTNATLTPLTVDITAEKKDVKFEVEPYKAAK